MVCSDWFLFTQESNMFDCNLIKKDQFYSLVIMKTCWLILTANIVHKFNVKMTMKIQTPTEYNTVLIHVNHPVTTTKSLF